MKREPKNEVLIGGIERRAIEILDYDPLWQTSFETHAKIIADVLGDAALLIEHIGSTAVTGLAAKPIIDMLLVVEDSGDEPSYLRKMEMAGYVLRVREPDFHQHRMFRTTKRDVHIHVFSSGSAEVERLLTLRDWLRQSLRARQRYERTKRELAAESWSDMNAYAAAKAEVVEGIIAAARAAGEVSHLRQPASSAVMLPNRQKSQLRALPDWNM